MKAEVKKKVRLPRKAKKKLINETARSEYELQKWWIQLGILEKFV
jgi:hypothetical protein